MKTYSGLALKDMGLKMEIEDKELLSDKQARFRRGKSTASNVYILNCIVQRELTGEGA